MVEDGDYNISSYYIMSFDNQLIKKIDSNKIDTYTKDDEKYKSWIPNNSGYIRPNLIGLSQNKETRFRVNHDNDSDTFNITVVNYNLDLKDDLPNYISITKIFIKRLCGRLKNTNKIVKTIKEYGYFKNDDEQIFINNIQLVEDINNSSPNLLTKENLIKKINTNNASNIGYIGKAYLCSLTPRDFKQLLTLDEVYQFKILNSRVELNQKDIDDNFNKFSNYFSNKNSNFIYAFSINYKIELKGIITLYDLKIIINEGKEIKVIHNLDNFDRKIEVIQQLLTLIKMDIHGDSHHHYKSDTILKIVPEIDFNNETTILNQITHFVKILDKVEQKRKTLPCNQLIPSFKFDSEGVNCYANVYKKLYVTNNNNPSFEDDILKSIKTINDRNEESIRLKNKTKNAHFDFFKSLVPFAILTVGFFSLLFNKDFTELIKDFENIVLFKSNILVCINFILEYKLIVLFILIGIILLPHIKIYFCFKRYLFKDARPRDMTAVKLLYLYHNNEISFLKKHAKILLGVTGLAIALFYFKYPVIISYINSFL
jgi:hypothetical protein